ncbi:AGRF5 protein, partial [Chionis minor]|nr:AGRF5 protein [Chionis minor]
VIIFDLPHVEYTIDVEVSIMDSSFLMPIKDYIKNLSLPILTNISNAEMRISNISVTTVCLPSGENNSCCSCEKGYAWPSVVCNDLIICPSASLKLHQSCSYTTKMPFYRPYCKPETEDSCGMGDPIVMSMSVRLDIDFPDELNDSSSDLYKKYKADLETAFNESYSCLPGFVSATVTSFKPGSVFVNYEVKAGRASFDQIASSNKIVPQLLDPLYQLNQSTFKAEITNQTNFTVSPEDIFEGDTVQLNCEINSRSENVTWYHSDQIISSSFRYSIQTIVQGSSSVSILKITNVTMNDSGSYSCSFANNHFHALIYKATKTVAVSPLNITANVKNISVTCNSPEMQTNGPLLSCCIDKHIPSLTGDWKVNGTINITGVSSFSENCTEYKLNINESLCPPETSGTVTTYTCELQTGHGARRSQNIRVMYLRKANVTISSSVNSTIFEGHRFNVTCKSDVRNYDRICWKIQSGKNTTTVVSDKFITNNQIPVTSVLTVETATRNWSGTYICSFYQKHLESSASMTIEVIPSLVNQSIMIDPIEALIPCGHQQTLQCCIRANTRENYTVAFVVQNNEFQAEKRITGNLVCYTYNYTETECKTEKNVTAHCKFTNHIGKEAKSDCIKLKVTTGKKKISCSDNLGIGVEGATLLKPCNESDNSDGFIRGHIVYKCSDKSWIILSNNCLSVEINNLLTSAQSLVNSPDASAKLPNYLEELKNQTEKEQSPINSSANLGAIVTILKTVSVIPVKAEKSTIENFLFTVDFIVDNSTTEVWNTLNKKEGLGSSSLLQSVENFSLNLQPVNNTIPPVSTKTLQLKGIVVIESNTSYDADFHSTENLTVNVLIGEKEIQNLAQNSTIVSVMYSKLGNLLPENKTKSVNSLLITTTLSSNRSQNFNINMTFAKKNSSLEKPQCVFWNFKLNECRGGWDDQGCNTTDAEDNVICSCNHLTSFSVLMSPGTSPQVIIEDYITYIGLAISILSLVICIIIESLVWKYVTNNTTSYMRHVCILNIATSLLIADIWFIVTASIADQNRQISKNICYVATFFIHLFYLCSFFWMLSLGLILFYRLVFILHDTSKTTQKAVAFCLGYGCPFVIAAVTIGVTLPRNNYTRDGVCWLKWEDSKTLLAFVIPALMIVTMNLFITAVVIIKILRPTIGDRSNRQEKNALFQIGKSVAILTPLLGLTWGFGMATIIENSHRVLHILFALLNALQGLFILVFGTLWDKKILEALLKRNSMSKWSSQQTKVRTL